MKLSLSNPLSLQHVQALPHLKLSLTFPMQSLPNMSVPLLLRAFAVAKFFKPSMHVFKLSVNFPSHTVLQTLSSGRQAKLRQLRGGQATKNCYSIMS